MASQEMTLREVCLADHYEEALAAKDKHIAELERRIASAAAQCDNVIFNCEQVPADNAQHLRSWRSLRDFLRQQ